MVAVLRHAAWLLAWVETLLPAPRLFFCLPNAHNAPSIGVSITVSKILSVVVYNFRPKWSSPSSSYTGTVV